MQKIVDLPRLKERAPERISLRSVLPLLEYLHSLRQDFSDRTLSWEEDELACDLLLCLPMPRDPAILRLVEFFADPQYHRSRSLCVWYGIARTVARCIQDGL